MIASQMTYSPAGAALVREFEGKRLDAYCCSAGVPTIGYGSTLGVKLGMRIDDAEAERRLAADLESAAAAVSRVVRVPLTQSQFDALVSFVFNLGVKAFTNSTLLRVLNKGETLAAADEFLRWNKVLDSKTKRFRVEDGLTRRRQAERELFLKGVLT